MMALNDEWVKTFGKWRVTMQEVDLAIELCKAEWTRVPENVTKVFREKLDAAIEKIKTQMGVKSSEPKGYRELDGVMDAGVKVCARLKEKYPQASWMKEIPMLLDGLKNQAKAKHPEASDLEVLRIVWRML